MRTITCHSLTADYTYDDDHGDVDEDHDDADDDHDADDVYCRR